MRRKILIKALQKADGQLIKYLTEMQQLTLNFYKSLYTSEGVEGIEEVLDKVSIKVTEGVLD